MKPKMIARLTCDVLMTAALPLLMAYERVGRAAHEWIGTGMLLAFLVHHILNFPWSERIFRGKYTAFRVFQTWIAGMLFLCMIGLAYSGVLLSRHVFSALPIQGGRSLARTLHMLCSYWGFAFMGIHLGLHWSMILGIAGKGQKKSAIRTLFLRGIAIVIAVCGAYVLYARQIGNYMLLQSHFVFFDYEEPRVLFLLDYAAVMGSFVFIGHALSKCLKRTGRKKKRA